jgi:small subunit ribosomal protein S6
MTSVAQAALPPRQYEVIYILRPDITKETAERVAGRVEEVVSREGGKLTLVENWGRRPMAYEIQHHKRGNYVYVQFLGNGALVAELERNFRLLDEVMRFQTVKLSDDPGEVEVDAERIKFEAIEPPVEGEEEELSLEQELGLVQGPRPIRSSSRDDDDMSDDDDDDRVMGGSDDDEEGADS